MYWLFYFITLATGAGVIAIGLLNEHGSFAGINKSDWKSAGLLLLFATVISFAWPLLYIAILIAWLYKMKETKFELPI